MPHFESREPQPPAPKKKTFGQWMKRATDFIGEFTKDSSADALIDALKSQPLRGQLEALDVIFTDREQGEEFSLRFPKDRQAEVNSLLASQSLELSHFEPDREIFLQNEMMELSTFIVKQVFLGHRS